MNMGKTNCKWCAGTGIMCRTKDDGRIWICSCIPVYSWPTTREIEISASEKMELLRNSGWNEDKYVDKDSTIY